MLTALDARDRFVTPLKGDLRGLGLEVIMWLTMSSVLAEVEAICVDVRFSLSGVGSGLCALEPRLLLCGIVLGDWNLGEVGMSGIVEVGVW